MKQTLILIVLALGMCNINVSAQTKKYKVENDGFEWYQISENGKYGVLDKYGNLIVPPVYGRIKYQCDNYDRVPYNSSCFICKEGYSSDDFMSSEYYVIYNRRGQVLFKSRDRFSYLSFTMIIATKKFRISVNKNVNGQSLWGIVSKNGSVVVPLIYDDFSGSNTYPIEAKQGGIWKKIPMDKLSTALLGKDFFKNNNPYTESVPSLQWTNNYSSSSSSSSSSTESSNSSSRNNSGNKTTTIVVEHQHTPQPMTEWVPCGACGHNPGVCQTCLGMGESASGRRCISCHGTGKCHFCNGQGGRYQTVYR